MPSVWGWHVQRRERVFCVPELPGRRLRGIGRAELGVCSVPAVSRRDVLDCVGCDLCVQLFPLRARDVRDRLRGRQREHVLVVRLWDLPDGERGLGGEQLHGLPCGHVPVWVWSDRPVRVLCVRGGLLPERDRGVGVRGLRSGRVPGRRGVCELLAVRARDLPDGARDGAGGQLHEL